jgi:protoheme IX farnesyltransferase
MAQALLHADPSVADYWQLLKPRVMSLVIFTGACGVYLAPGTIHPLLALTALLCLSVGAGAAGCLNMWAERHTDSLMKRTQNRPLVRGLVDADSALAFGLILASASVLIMGVAINGVAAFWLAFTIFFYVVVYTLYLKPKTPQNIVIGGLAGALPPVIGWASVAHATPPEAWSLCLIIFLWTPAHFWALALTLVDDYRCAKTPMLPCVVGERKTLHGIFLYAFLTCLAAFLPYFLNFTSFFYFVMACLLNGIFISFSALVWLKKISPLAFFSASIFYLFFLFLSMLF